MQKMIIIWFLSFISLCAKAQDPQFSQYYAIPTYLGPSFAGTTEGERIVANYRNQWTGVPKTYVTYSLAYDKNYHDLKSGVGGLIIRDQLSPSFSKTMAGIQYSYKFYLERQRIYIRPGLTFYYFNVYYDKSNIVLGHQLEGKDITLPPSNLPVIEPVHKLDFNTSVLVYTDYLWAGLAVDHLTRTNESLTNTKTVTPIKYTFFGGYKYDFHRRSYGNREEHSATGTFLYKRQNNYDQLDIGAYYTRHPLTLGMWYRGIPVENNVADKIDHDAIVLLAGLKYNQLKMAYSFDISISSIFLLSKGTHEITLSWEIPYKDPREKIKPIPCPQF